MNENAKEESRKKLQKLLLPILALIAVIAVIIAVMAKEPPVQPMVPDVAPRETESHAEALPESDADQEPAQEGGGSVSLTFSKQVQIDLAAKQASLVFANPQRSNQNMVLQLRIRDEVIFQSDLLTPGNMLREMDLAEGQEKLLTAGSYEGCFQVFYYDPVSGEKAVVNTEIPVEVTVK